MNQTRLIMLKRLCETDLKHVLWCKLWFLSDRNVISVSSFSAKNITSDGFLDTLFLVVCTNNIITQWPVVCLQQFRTLPLYSLGLHFYPLCQSFPIRSHNLQVQDPSCYVSQVCILSMNDTMISPLELIACNNQERGCASSQLQKN